MKIFVLIFLFIAASCGQKSKIHPLFKPTKLAEVNGLGDGKYVVINVKLPLSDRTLDAVDTPVDPHEVKIPIFGDFAHLITKSIYNLGASMGLGRRLIKIQVPIPDLDSELIHSIKVKRIFFNVEKKDALEKPKVTLKSLWNKFRRLLRGEKDELDFGFVRELNLRVSSIDGPGDLGISDINVDMTEISDQKLKQWELFSEGTHEVLSYKRGETEKLKPMSEKIIIHSDNPVYAKNFFTKNIQMQDIVQEVTLLNKKLLVELKDIEMAPEIFYQILEESHEAFEKMQVLRMDRCQELTCMDFVLNDVNLKPIAIHGNRFVIETYLDVSKIPPQSFQLRGFVDFEVKLDLPI